MQPAAAAWENVHIAVYVLKETAGALPDNAGYLTMLDTPEYRTLKHKNNIISRVYYTDKKDEILDGDDFYEALVEHSENNEVYTLIHEGFTAPQKMEKAVQEMKLVINREKLPADLRNNDVIKALDENVLELDNYFDEKGYVVANVNKLAQLSPRIEKFVEVSDKESRLFFEAVFKT